MNNLVSRAFDTLHALLIASIIGTILIGASAVFGDDSAFYWDGSGKMQMSDTWSPMSPNRRTTESDRRNYNDWVNSQTLKQNEALIEGYYNSKPSAPPSHGNQSFWLTPGPGERSRLCSQVGAQVICQ